MENPLEQILDTPDALTRLAVQYGPSLLSAALIMVVGFLRHALGRRGLPQGGLRRFPLEPPVRDLILRDVRVLVFLVFALMALQNLGIDLLPLIAGLGIAGAGIALALQGVLGNVAAGLTIIFTRPFRVGEYISIAGEEGLVQKISLFSTTLRHADLSQVVIPNRKIVGEILHNYGEIRQLDLERAASPMRPTSRRPSPRSARCSPRIRACCRTRRRSCRPTPLGEYAIRIAIRPWVAVKDFGAAPGEINPAIVRAFERARHRDRRADAGRAHGTVGAR